MKLSKFNLTFLLTLILTSTSLTVYASDSIKDVSSPSLIFGTSETINFSQVSNNPITSKELNHY